MNGAIRTLLLQDPSIRKWFERMLSPWLAIGLTGIILGSQLIPRDDSTLRSLLALTMPLLIAQTVLRLAQRAIAAGWRNRFGA